MKPKLSWSLVGLLALVLGLAPVAGALADKPPAATYLALGDSLAVGVGAFPDHQQDQFGYVGRFDRWFKDTRDGPHGLVNVAVSGERSAGFIDTQLPQALAAINAESDVQVVTLDIGGNDLRDLLAGPCAPPTPDMAECLPAAQQTVGVLAYRHGVALQSLQVALAADPGDETILVMGLYNPYKGSGTPFEGLVDTVLAGYNGAVSQVASAYGARFVNVYPLFDPAAPLLADDGYHANNDGYAAIAAAFEAAAQ